MFVFSKTILLLCSLGIYFAVGEEVEIIGATATKWDLRDSTDSGCGDVGGEGCKPGYTIDGWLNNVPGSRWSCNDAEIPEEDQPCYITWKLESLQSLDNITLYFFKSNDSGRTPNEFNLSISVDGLEFTDVIVGVSNIIPLPLGQGDAFQFEAGDQAEYIRLTGINSDEQWLSLCEAKVFGSGGTVAPTPFKSSAPTVMSSGISPEPSPTSVPTTPTPVTESSETSAPLVVTTGPVNTLAPLPIIPTIAPSMVSMVDGIKDKVDDEEEEDDNDRERLNAIIVGGVCGGVVLLLLVCLGVCCCSRRNVRH